MDLADVSIHRWIQKNKLVNEKGEPIEFSNHLFLFDIYRDQSQRLVVMKAAQVGMSTLEVLKTLYDAQYHKLDVIYTLPADSDVQIFVGGKVNRLIAQNPALLEAVKDKDSVEQKQVGESMVYFRGTWTEKAAIMVTADRLVHDEKDSSKQEILKQYEARLQHSKFKQIHVFSHPSVPGGGVDVEWQISDQKHWFVLCRACKTDQFLSWPQSIDPERKCFQCKYCHAELTDDDRRRGRWVAKYADRKYSGYWVPLLICPWVSAEDILDKYNDPKSTEEFFFNKVLGLPYAGSGNVVTQDVLWRNLTNKVNDQTGRVIIGVDSGIDLRFVVGNRQGIFYYGQCKTWEEIEELMAKWERSVVVVDQGGDIIGPRQLREKYPGRVFLCHYSVDRKTQELIRWGKNDEDGNVVVDRNRMLQLVIDEFVDRRIPLFGTQADWHDYWLHWSHIYRQAEEDRLGVVRYSWKRSDRDDWCHATLYWRVGMARFNAEGEGSLIGRSAVLNIPVVPVWTPGQKVQVRAPAMNWNVNKDWRD